MTIIIKLIEIKYKKNKYSYVYKNLKILFDKLSNVESKYHKEIIVDFIRNTNIDREHLKSIFHVIDINNHLNSTLDLVVNSMTHENLREIINSLSILQTTNTDIIERLEYILALAEFWAHKLPNVPFSKIIPPNKIMDFLKQFQSRQFYKKI